MSKLKAKKIEFDRELERQVKLEQRARAEDRRAAGRRVKAHRAHNDALKREADLQRQQHEEKAARSKVFSDQKAVDAAKAARSRVKSRRVEAETAKLAEDIFKKQEDARLDKEKRDRRAMKVDERRRRDEQRQAQAAKRE